MAHLQFEVTEALHDYHPLPCTDYVKQAMVILKEPLRNNRTPLPWQALKNISPLSKLHQDLVSIPSKKRKVSVAPPGKSAVNDRSERAIKRSKQTVSKTVQPSVPSAVKRKGKGKATFQDDVAMGNTDIAEEVRMKVEDLEIGTVRRDIILDMQLYPHLMTMLLAA